MAMTKEEKKSRDKALYLERMKSPAYRDKRNVATQEWKKKNKERNDENRKKYNARRDHVNALQRAWVAKNIEHLRALRRKYQKLDPHQFRAKAAKRRGAPGKWTAEDIAALRTVLGDRCMACRTALGDCVDHVVPIAKGGSSWPINLQFLCRSCNSAKGVKDTDHRTDAQKKIIQSLFV